GITNCIGFLYPLIRLQALVQKRDECNIDKDPFCPRKVYQWTTDNQSRFRSILRMQVDGFITNYPNRLNEVLREPEFATKFRLATNRDNPWQIYK
ncbi:hypothetical protein B4U80_08219, partial [Leptotrombidium deliense]